MRMAGWVQDGFSRRFLTYGSYDPKKKSCAPAVLAVPDGFIELGFCPLEPSRIQTRHAARVQPTPGGPLANRCRQCKKKENRGVAPTIRHDRHKYASKCPRYGSRVQEGALAIRYPIRALDHDRPQLHEVCCGTRRRPPTTAPSSRGIRFRRHVPGSAPVWIRV